MDDDMPGLPGKQSSSNMSQWTGVASDTSRSPRSMEDDLERGMGYGKPL
jgi:hypothetical protein